MQQINTAMAKPRRRATLGTFNSEEEKAPRRTSMTTRRRANSSGKEETQLPQSSTVTSDSGATVLGSTLASSRPDYSRPDHP